MSSHFFTHVGNVIVQTAIEFSIYATIVVFSILSLLMVIVFLLQFEGPANVILRVLPPLEPPPQPSRTRRPPMDGSGDHY
jgi:hypothetical protein